MPLPGSPALSFPCRGTIYRARFLCSAGLSRLAFTPTILVGAPRMPLRRRFCGTSRPFGGPLEPVREPRSLEGHGGTCPDPVGSRAVVAQAFRPEDLIRGFSR